MQLRLYPSLTPSLSLSLSVSPLLCRCQCQDDVVASELSGTTVFAVPPLLQPTLSAISVPTDARRVCEKSIEYERTGVMSTGDVCQSVAMFTVCQTPQSTR